MVCIYSLSLCLSEIAFLRICNYQITGTEVIYAANADDKNEHIAGTLWLALGSISIIFGSISTASSILFLGWNRAKGLKWATMAFAFAAGALAFGAWRSAFYGDNKCATNEGTNMFPPSSLCVYALTTLFMTTIRFKGWTLIASSFYISIHLPVWSFSRTVCRRREPLLESKTDGKCEKLTRTVK